MPKPASRRQTLASLLPAIDTDRWAVCLHFMGGSSDKEYRIAVDGAITTIQFGAWYADGQTARYAKPDHAAASAFARKKWAEKEAKGYGPTTGIMPLTRPIDTYPLRTQLNRRFSELVDLLAGVAARPTGDILWLCQVPPYDAPSDASGVLSDLSRKAGLLHGGKQLQPGAYALVAVTASDSTVLRGVCPVALELGSVAAADTTEIAAAAAALAGDNTGDGNDRENLDNAVGTARAIFA